MRADLNQRTVRGRNGNGLQPYIAGEERVNFGRTDGYFYVSENRPENDTDDLLQFTVRIDPSKREPFYGKATPIPGATRNQPVWDDGDPTNKSGTSTAAEVVYFLRNGNLYRRVLLIRKPLVPGEAQPDGLLGASNFWGEFDYSASYDAGSGNVQFHDEAWLTNDLNQTITQTLGLRKNRFGFNHDDSKSREFDTNGTFFGRFTHEETSHANFQYPTTAANNPMDETTGSNPSTFANGSRRGEDILMTEVHSFDVKLWNGTAYVNSDFDTGHPNDAGSTGGSAKAIRITIRYFDVTSEQFRQLTIDKSLLD